MKTIIVVSFFGILTNAFAQDSKEQRCHREAMKGFDSTKYLQMPRTYETHTENAPIPVPLCRVTEAKQISDGNVDSITYEYYRFTGGIFYSESHCNTTVESMKTGQFSEDCRVTKDTYLDDPEFLKDEVDKVYISVIDTDYKNYAILYRCEDDGEFGITDNILVLKTKNNGKYGQVRKALKKIGKELRSFSRRNKKADCDKKET